MSLGINLQLSIFVQQQFQAAVTRTISTAESPGRWQQARATFFAKNLNKLT